LGDLSVKTKLTEHNKRVTSALVLSGDIMVSGDLSGKVILWNITSGKYEQTILVKESTRENSVVKFANINNDLLVVHGDGSCRLWDMATLKCQKVFKITDEGLVNGTHILRDYFIVLTQKGISLLDFNLNIMSKSESKEFFGVFKSTMLCEKYLVMHSTKNRYCLLVYNLNTKRFSQLAEDDEVIFDKADRGLYFKPQPELFTSTSAPLSQSQSRSTRKIGMKSSTALDSSQRIKQRLNYGTTKWEN
jgi:WD40 repeat protein